MCIRDRNSFIGVHRDTYWDLAIPWWDGTVIGCYESYSLMHIATIDNELLDAIRYFPGISVFSDYFNNIWDGIS